MNYEELIKAVRAGDDVAFMALWNTVDPKAVSALKRGLRREDWEDIEQNAKLAFWQAIMSGVAIDNVPAYIQTTLATKVADYSRNNVEEDAAFSFDDDESLHQELIDDCNNPELQAEISSLLRYIKRMLSGEEYNCWRLATQHGYTIDEIAQKTGIHRSSVHRNIQRAEKKVVDIMREEGYDEDFLLQWEHSNIPMDGVIEEDE